MCIRDRCVRQGIRRCHPEHRVLLLPQVPRRALLQGQRDPLSGHKRHPSHRHRRPGAVDDGGGRRGAVLRDTPVPLGPRRSPDHTGGGGRMPHRDRRTGRVRWTEPRLGRELRGEPGEAGRGGRRGVRREGALSMPTGHGQSISRCTSIPGTWFRNNVPATEENAAEGTPSGRCAGTWETMRPIRSRP